MLNLARYVFTYDQQTNNRIGTWNQNEMIVRVDILTVVLNFCLALSLIKKSIEARDEVDEDLWFLDILVELYKSSELLLSLFALRL